MSKNLLQTAQNGSSAGNICIAKMGSSRKLFIEFSVCRAVAFPRN
jgi:hypothetical protein